ncbi:MAG: hypothetical protein JXB88_25485, partial [Spirochaetales bacterium]|nr:hypothetical protein [Spirochaetales bacterium]
KGYAELYNLARAIREAEDVSAEIEKALSEAGKEIADAGKEVKKYSIKSFRQMIDEFVIGISKTLINLPQVIAEVFVAVGKSVAGFFTGAFKLLINPVKEMETIFNSLVSGMENATWNLIDSLKGLYDAIFAEGIERYAEGRGKTVEELTPEEQKAARVFAGLDMFANILNWIVSQLVDIVASTEVFRQYMSDFGEALRIVIETAVIPLIQALHPLIVVVVQVVQIIFQLLVPVFQIFGKVIQMLMPLFVAVGQLVINIIGVLRMFIPIMAVIVVTVGKVLTPIVEALANVFAFLGEIVGAIAPVFDAIGYVVDAVGRVFRTMFVIVEFLTSPFKALGELIYYIVTFQWGKIGKIHIMSPAELADALEDIWSEGWTTGEFEGFDVDFEDVPALELEIEDISDLGAEDFGATVYGGNVSVQQAPDIYIYQTFDGNIIGAGGMVEVGEFVVEAIREYVGAGGQVVWEEG